MSQTLGKTRLCALFAALFIAVSCLMAGSAIAYAADGNLTAGSADTAPTAQADGTEAKWHTVDFNLAVNLKKINIKWDWNDLLQDATKAGENKNLLVAGIVLSEEAELSKGRVEAVLTELGFENIESDYYPLSTSTKNDVNEPARTFGQKVITKDGKQYHVVCAVFKGTTTLDDAITDIESVKDGFLKAGQNCTNSLTSYLSSIGATKENTILFITGHSLGASTANVVGRLSTDLAYDSAKFVYSIASPNYELGSDKGKDAPNFRTFTNTDDLVPYVPVSTLLHPFGKIGVERLYTYSKLSSQEKGRFDAVYRYLTDKWYEDDIKDHDKLKNHLCQTYLSFALCDLDANEIAQYGMSRENKITVTPKAVSVNPGVKTVLQSSDILDIADAAGDITFSKTYGDTGITISENGKVTIAKSVKPRVYRLGIAVKAAGDAFYQEKTVYKTVKITVKKVNTITVKSKTATVKAGKKVTLKRSKVLTVKNAIGKVTYAKLSGNKKITVKSNGKVVVKKGLKKKKTYKVKVAVTAAGDSSYGPKTVTKVFKVKVK